MDYELTIKATTKEDVKKIHDKLLLCNKFSIWNMISNSTMAS